MIPASRFSCDGAILLLKTEKKTTWKSCLTTLLKTQNGKKKRDNGKKDFSTGAVQPIFCDPRATRFSASVLRNPAPVLTPWWIFHPFRKDSPTRAQPEILSVRPIWKEEKHCCLYHLVSPAPLTRARPANIFSFWLDFLWFLALKEETKN